MNLRAVGINFTADQAASLPEREYQEVAVYSSTAYPPLHETTENYKAPFSNVYVPPDVPERVEKQKKSKRWRGLQH